MRALLAEDNVVMRRLLEALLQQAGHEVTAVADGAAAWAAYEQTPFPLVVLDWQMPELDGLEVCRRVRASPTSAGTFVLLVTGRDEAADLTQALDAGADDYLTKPVTPGHFHARVTIAERRLALSAAHRRAEESLREARWMAGIGETALALQHEINNPLAALLGYVSLAALGGNTPEDLQEYMRVIGEQARRIAGVVKRLTEMRDLRTVDYMGGARMLDLSPDAPPSSDAALAAGET